MCPKRVQVQGAVLVHLKHATNVVAADPNGLSDPYVIMRIGKEEKRSVCMYRTLEPVWEEKHDWTQVCYVFFLSFFCMHAESESLCACGCVMIALAVSCEHVMCLCVPSSAWLHVFSSWLRTIAARQMTACCQCTPTVLLQQNSFLCVHESGSVQNYAAVYMSVGVHLLWGAPSSES